MATRKSKRGSGRSAVKRVKAKAKSKPKAKVKSTAKAKSKAKPKARAKARAAPKRKASAAPEAMAGLRRATLSAAEPEAAPVDLYALVCSTDGQLDGGLGFAACMDLARDHNDENAEHDAHCVRQLPQDPE